MLILPMHGERSKVYDRLISANDDYIKPIIQAFSKIGMYAHTVDAPCYGYGITLIPTQATERFVR